MFCNSLVPVGSQRKQRGNAHERQEQEHLRHQPIKRHTSFGIATLEASDALAIVLNVPLEVIRLVQVLGEQKSTRQRSLAVGRGARWEQCTNRKNTASDEQ